MTKLFSRTHTSFSPWIIVRANNKKQARLESIQYLLNLLPYAEKESATVGITPIQTSWLDTIERLPISTERTPLGQAQDVSENVGVITRPAARF